MVRRGIRCATCGDYIDYSTMIDGDYHECDECGALFCLGCAPECIKCGKTVCEDCGGYVGCDQCGESICRSCLEKCDICGYELCFNCLTKIDGKLYCDECVTIQNIKRKK